MDTVTIPQQEQAESFAAQSGKGASPKELKLPWRRAFIRYLAQSGSATHSAKRAGITVQTAYAIRAKSTRFADAWTRALKEAKRYKVDRAEREAFHRAVNGRDEPVYQGGELVGYKRKRSDVLLLRTLEAEYPRKWSRKFEHKTTNATILMASGLSARMFDDPAVADAACALVAAMARPQLLAIDNRPVQAHEQVAPTVGPTEEPS